MTEEIIHSITLIITIALSFILLQTPLASYQLQISALFFIIYFILKKLSPPNKRSILSHHLFDAIVFSFVILSLVNSSGGINSPLFFLTYFLIFALALLLEPVIAISTTLALIICYLISLPENQSLVTLLPLFSLPFLAPFALFLGREYEKNATLKRENQQLENEKDEERKESFLFMSLNLKKELRSIWEKVENYTNEQDGEEIKKSVENAQNSISNYEKDL